MKPSQLQSKDQPRMIETISAVEQKKGTLLLSGGREMSQDLVQSRKNRKNLKALRMKNRNY